MLPPLPRCSSWAYSSLISPSRISLPRKGCRVGLHIVRFEACSAFTRVAACTLARSPIRDPLPEGFRHFVASMPAPVASGWSGYRVGLAPTGKRRLVTAHTAQRTVPLRRVLVAGFFIDRPRRLGCTRALAHAKEPRARPMCPGDLRGNHGQRAKALALVFEPILAHKDGMGVPAPLPHQARAGLQHHAGIERTSAFLQLSREALQAALQ